MLTTTIPSSNPLMKILNDCGLHIKEEKISIDKTPKYFSRLLSSHINELDTTSICEIITGIEELLTNKELVSKLIDPLINDATTSMVGQSLLGILLSIESIQTDLILKVFEIFEKQSLIDADQNYAPLLLDQLKYLEYSSPTSQLCILDYTITLIKTIKSLHLELLLEALPQIFLKFNSSITESDNFKELITEIMCARSRISNVDVLLDCLQRIKICEDEFIQNVVPGIIDLIEKYPQDLKSIFLFVVVKLKTNDKNCLKIVGNLRDAFISVFRLFCEGEISYEGFKGDFLDALRIVLVYKSEFYEIYLKVVDKAVPKHHFDFFVSSFFYIYREKIRVKLSAVHLGRILKECVKEGVADVCFCEYFEFCKCFLDGFINMSELFVGSKYFSSFMAGLLVAAKNEDDPTRTILDFVFLKFKSSELADVGHDTLLKILDKYVNSVESPRMLQFYYDNLLCLLNSNIESTTFLSFFSKFCIKIFYYEKSSNIIINFINFLKNFGSKNNENLLKTTKATAILVSDIVSWRHDFEDIDIIWGEIVGLIQCCFTSEQSTISFCDLVSSLISMVNHRNNAAKNFNNFIINHFRQNYITTSNDDTIISLTTSFAIIFPKNLQFCVLPSLMGLLFEFSNLNGPKVCEEIAMAGIKWRKEWPTIQDESMALINCLNCCIESLNYLCGGDDFDGRLESMKFVVGRFAELWEKREEEATAVEALLGSSLRRVKGSVLTAYFSRIDDIDLGGECLLQLFIGMLFKQTKSGLQPPDPLILIPFIAKLIPCIINNSDDDLLTQTLIIIRQSVITWKDPQKNILIYLTELLPAILNYLQNNPILSVTLDVIELVRHVWLHKSQQRLFAAESLLNADYQTRGTSLLVLRKKISHALILLYVNLDDSFDAAVGSRLLEMSKSVVYWYLNVPTTISYSLLTSETFETFYKTICDLHVKAASCCSGQWELVATGFGVLVDILRTKRTNKRWSALVSLLMRKSCRILGGFRRNFLTEDVILLLSDKETVESKILSSIQKSARKLHQLCAHSKLIRDNKLSVYVPALKRELEGFILDVKRVFTRGSSLGAFSVGNLKHRSVFSGDVISSQIPAECGESDSTEMDVEE